MKGKESRAVFAGSSSTSICRLQGKKYLSYKERNTYIIEEILQSYDGGNT